METKHNNNSQRIAMPSWGDIPRILSGPHKPDDDHLDALIADAMNQLSVKDREKVFHDIHGVSEEIEESSEFVNTKLDELQQELICIKGNKHDRYPTAALELAESLSPSYVMDPKLRVGFLRTENFNAKLAAERMVNFFDFKFAMFGGEKLCKNITYDDLNQHDKEALERGFLQLLPARDRAGRVVVVFFPSQQKYNDACDAGTCYGRICLYLRTLFEDETAERKGAVLILYNVGEFHPEGLYPQVPPVYMRLRKAMPFKIVSLHFCFSNSIFRTFVQYSLKAFDRELRAGGRCHQGSQQEVIYALMTYGIPTDRLPITFDNEIKRTAHFEMLKMTRIREEYIGNGGDKECVVIPYVNDVLFGKGGSTQDSTGNVRLKMIVDEKLEEYNTLEKNAKFELAKDIVQMIKRGGGRFLSKDTGVWMEVADTIARSKVATLFRNRRKAGQKKATNSNQVVFPPPTTASKAPRSNSAILSYDRSGTDGNKRAKV